MKAIVRTEEKCQICGGRFKDTRIDLECPKCKTTPRKYFLNLWYEDQRIRKYYNSYYDAQRAGTRAEREINTGEFNIAEWKNSTAFESTNKNSFSNRYKEWLKGREAELKRDEISPDYYRKLKDYQKLFNKQFGRKDITNIRKREIDKFRNEKLSDMSLKTQKNIISMLRAFFRTQHEYEDGSLPTMPKFPIIKPDEPERDTLEIEERLRVYECIPDEDKAIFLFMFGSGLRPSESRAIKWKNIKAEEIEIKASFCEGIYRTTTKTKNKWDITITPEMREALNMVPRALPEAFVFTYGRGRPYGMKKLRTIWHTARKEAKVRYIKMYNGVRHTTGRKWTEQGIPLNIIGDMMGHTCLSTTKKYASGNKVKLMKEAFAKIS